MLALLDWSGSVPWNSNGPECSKGGWVGSFSTIYIFAVYCKLEELALMLVYGRVCDVREYVLAPYQTNSLKTTDFVDI
jgi:hypothetical protein